MRLGLILQASEKTLEPPLDIQATNGRLPYRSLRSSYYPTKQMSTPMQMEVTQLQVEDKV